MKQGFSKFSRPTTAKKPAVKPIDKTLSIETDQLTEIMEQLLISQKECEKSGKYVEAEGFKRKIKILQEESGKRDLLDIKQRHEKERKEIEEAHLEELNCFNIEWDEKVGELHRNVTAMEEQLIQRHEEQIRLIEEEMMNEKPTKFKESAQLLNLRKMEQELAKQENYMQAHQVQLKAQKLEKEELQKWKKDQSSKCKSNLNVLKQKQEGQLSALKQRIGLAYDERNRQKHQDFEKIMLKYQNVVKELEFQQKQEIGRFEKSVKLQQVQKKTKIGTATLSSSKMSLA